MSARRGLSIKVSFTRSQISSLSATAVDYVLTIITVHAFKFWPVIATGIGAFFGALTHFSLGRIWSFKASHERMVVQMRRYASVAICSLLLNSLGLWGLTALGGWKWFPAKVMTSLVIGFFFNFPLHRYFVFR